jgi:hypothetical protein
MKVGAAIYSMLKDDSAVSALVGTRIYPELAEEGAVTPYVVYSVVSNTPVDTKESAPVDEAQLEVFSVADTYAAANDLADKVRAALSRQSKKVYGTVTVQSVKYTNEVTEVSAERNMYISVQDYTARLTPVIPNLLLEQYENAYIAYSLRRVRGEYTGPAIKVRRDGDGATLDIGFTENYTLDTTSLLAFYDGSTAIRVQTLYDQSGNNRHTSQTDPTEAPAIVYSNGNLIALDGQPAMQFFGTDDALPFVGTDLDIGSLSSFMVMRTLEPDAFSFPLTISVSDDKRFYPPFINSGNFNYAYGTHTGTVSTASNSLKNLHTQIAGATQGNMTAFLNGSSVGSVALDSGVGGSFTEGIGGVNGANFFDGFIQEIVIYDSDQSANRTGIESNINTHYSIY